MLGMQTVVVWNNGNEGWRNGKDPENRGNPKQPEATRSNPRHPKQPEQPGETRSTPEHPKYSRHREENRGKGTRRVTINIWR